nr:BOI-related E3 ubiquitin-protein ligase 1-like [Setaria viridis]
MHARMRASSSSASRREPRAPAFCRCLPTSPGPRLPPPPPLLPTHSPSPPTRYITNTSPYPPPLPLDTLSPPSSIECPSRFLGEMLQGTTMAVHQARFGGGLAGCLPLPPCAGGGILVDEHTWALKDYGALLSAAANDGGYRYDRAAQSDLTCNGGGGGGGAVAVPSRKRGIEDELERYYAAASSAALLPIPGMHEPVAVAPQSAATLGAVAASRMAESATASTSGRPAIPIAASVEDALVAELCQQGAEIDAIVRAECDRLRAGLEQARKRRCVELVRAAAAGAARVLRDREVELAAARRRAAELEERLRQAFAESQAWRDVARGNEAVAAGLRATLETVLLGGAGAGALAPTTKEVEEEGFGDSADPVEAADDARSCCFVEAEDGAAAAAPASRWACRACGGGEASVLLLPCRHLCLCKSCEPRADGCPVCLAAKNAAIHVAAN